MPIKGLTDQLKGVDKALMEPGKPIVFGYLQKGRREGFGKNVRLFDEDHFIFRPRGGDEDGQGADMARIFKAVYGDKPTIIPDVRIPIDQAENFKIEEYAWLFASRHSQRGSYQVARSDGTTISRYRNPETGRLDYVDMPHDQHTKVNQKGKEGLEYKGKFYPWAQQMRLPLLLTDFNRALYEERIAGLGVVSLLTQSTYDIANLIGEYYAMIDALVSTYANPMEPAEGIAVRRHLPLRDIPIILKRTQDKITTPDYRQDGDPAERLHSTRWLIHWTLAPSIAQRMLDAGDQRTQITLDNIANIPMIRAPEQQAKQLAELNAELFDIDPEPPQIEAVTGDDEPEPEQVTGEVVEEETEAEVVDGRLLFSLDLDEWASAAFRSEDGTFAFNTVANAKNWYAAAIGDFDPDTTEQATAALKVYAQQRADGIDKMAAAAAATAEYTKLVSVGF